MEERTSGERIDFGDILTPQEHNWRGSTYKFNPITPEQWHIPVGVSSRKITREQAKTAREKYRYAMMPHLPSILEVSGDVAMSLEAIDETTGQTENDPAILLAFLDKETDDIRPVIDETTEEVFDFTSKLIDLYRQRGLEVELHLRPRPTGEGQNPSLGEGNTGFIK